MDDGLYFWGGGALSLGLGKKRTGAFGVLKQGPKKKDDCLPLRVIIMAKYPRASGVDSLGWTGHRLVGLPRTAERYVLYVLYLQYFLRYHLPLAHEGR